MMVAGIIVGASGTLLTLLMAKAINQSVSNILLTPNQEGPTEIQGIDGALKPMNARDAGVMLAYAQKIIIVSGYGMAVARAKNKVWELAKLLMDRGRYSSEIRDSFCSRSHAGPYECFIS